MNKVVTKIKQTRLNWWEAFKGFMTLRGYKYYKIPKEIKYRYPAPGSVPFTQEDKPHLYKNNWKAPFRDSHFNIRAIPLKDNRFEGKGIWSAPEDWDLTNPAELARSEYPVVTPFTEVKDCEPRDAAFMLNEDDQVNNMWEELDGWREQMERQHMEVNHWSKLTLDD